MLVLRVLGSDPSGWKVLPWPCPIPAHSLFWPRPAGGSPRTADIAPPPPAYWPAPAPPPPPPSSVPSRTEEGGRPQSPACLLSLLTWSPFFSVRKAHLGQLSVSGTTLNVLHPGEVLS